MMIIMGKLKGNMIAIFFVSTLVLTFWEYIVGVLLEKIFKTKYWDYSDHKINFQGRICLTNSIAWGFLGIGFIEFIHPFVHSIVEMIDTNIFTNIINYSVIVIMIDIVVSIIKLSNIKPALEKVEKLNEEIKKKIKEIKAKNKKKAEEPNITEENIEVNLQKLENRRNKMMRKLYKYAYRLKKAFPAMNIKEITEILNRRKQMKEETSKDKRGK